MVFIIMPDPLDAGFFELWVRPGFFPRLRSVTDQENIAGWMRCIEEVYPTLLSLGYSRGYRHGYSQKEKASRFGLEAFYFE
jgi:hypothetical protein